MRSLSLRDPGFVGNLGGKDEFPIGGIIMWSSSTIPDGWAVCNGSNGTPDLRDRFVAGAGGAYSAGTTGGENSVALTTTTMPSHTHPNSLTINAAGGHAHAYTYGTTSFRAPGGYNFNRDGSTTTTGSSGGHSHSVSGTSGSTGSGTAHENRPPYRALNYIMRLS